MKKTRRYLALALALTMLLTLAACGAGAPAASPSAPAASSSAAASSAAPSSDVAPAIDTSQFVTVSHYVMGDPPKNGQLEAAAEEWNKLMKAKINTAMELKWIEWADWSTKYNMLLASGEPIDLIHTSSTWLDMWPNAQRGAFAELDDLIPQYAPLTWGEIPPEDWDQIRFNGKIIGFPENDYTQYVNHGFYYRGDWAKEAGITEPIKSFEQLGQYFAGIKKNHPEIVPYDVSIIEYNFEGWMQLKTDYITVPGVPTGKDAMFWAKSYSDYGTAVLPVMDETYVDFAKMMKEWSDAGYWREDALSFTGSPRDLLKEGKTGSDQHHTQTYKGLRVEMDEKQPGSDLQFFNIAEAKGFLMAEPITHGATSIGANSKNKERAVMVYELLRQDKEIYQLVNYGREGIQYEVKDGVRVRPAGYVDADHSYYSNYWGGRVDKFEIPSDRDYKGIFDIWARLDKIVKPFVYGKFIFDKTNVEAELAAISEVVNSDGVAIGMGKVADPVAAVEAYRNKLKTAGIEKVLAEVNTQLAAYKSAN